MLTVRDPPTAPAVDLNASLAVEPPDSPMRPADAEIAHGPKRDAGLRGRGEAMKARLAARRAQRP